MKHTLFAPALALLACSSLLLAADKPAAGNVSAADQKFVTDAAQGGLFEVEIGKVAQSQASNPACKQLGQMLVTDHGKANAELMKLAGKKGISAPTTLDAKHAGMLTTLSKKQGAEFDKAYLEALDKAHKKDIAEFETASTSASDPDLKAFAAKTLPTLRKHLEHIQAHQQQVAKH